MGFGVSVFLPLGIMVCGRLLTEQIGKPASSED